MVLLGKAGGPFSSSEVLSFNMPQAKNLAAPVARAGEGMQSVLSRRDAHANSATTPAVQEVSGLLQRLELVLVKLVIDHPHVLILSMPSVSACWCQVLDCCRVWLAAQERACPWRSDLIMVAGLSCSHRSSEDTVRGAQARFFCNAMPWVDCTALRYHCTKLPDIDLCPEAYAGGRFPPGCTARDFIKIDGARPPPVRQSSHPGQTNRRFHPM